MRRAPFVLTGTLVGLAGVLSFRSAPAALSLGGLGATSPTTTSAPATTTTTVAAGASPPTSVATPTTVHTTATTTPVTTPPTTTAPSGVRSATGSVINYFFGTMSVKVTASGSKITAVTIASLNDGGNPRSQYIDGQAIPMLIQQVMAAQGSHIQGVSGATYTSEGFYTSLLGALKTLGLK